LVNVAEGVRERLRAVVGVACVAAGGWEANVDDAASAPSATANATALDVTFFMELLRFSVRYVDAVVA
jgi:hypothetical protein